MRLLILNGPNLNLLGLREREIYGDATYSDLIDYIREEARAAAVEIEIYQSNHEGCLVDKIQSAYRRFDGIIINAAAYSHTSVAILDALKAVALPVVEVHLTDVSKREEFRRFSYVSQIAEKVFCGEGFVGYKKAIEFFAK